MNYIMDQTLVFSHCFINLQIWKVHLVPKSNFKHWQDKRPFLQFDFGTLTNRSKDWWCILKFCFEILFWRFGLLMEEILGLKQVWQDWEEI